MIPMGLRRVAVVGALLSVLVACTSPGGSAKARADDLAVEVASFDLTTGAPTRFVLGLVTVDQRLIGHGTVDLRFSYVGTKEGGANPTPFGPVVKASYLPVHGSVVPSPPPPRTRACRRWFAPRTRRGSQRRARSGRRVEAATAPPTRGRASRTP